MSSVSAIIPVYNGADYIRATVASVVAQTLQPLELFVVDDGSNDGTLQILESLHTPFALHVLRQERGFQSAARNLAAAQARGTYLAFLDHDDLWYPRHLEALVAPLERDARMGWSYSDIDEIDEHGQLVALQALGRYAPHVAHPKTDIFSMLASDMFIFPSAAVVRREAFCAVGGFDPRLSGYEDDDLFLRLFRAGWHNAYLSEPLTRYRRHTSSSSFSERMWKSREIFAGKLIESYPDNPELARWFVRDIIAPRFFHSALAEYARHLPRQRWAQCQQSLALMHRFKRLMRRPPLLRGLVRAAALTAMQWPRLLMALLPLVRNHPRINRLLG